MLLQIPLLTLVGWLAVHKQTRASGELGGWNHHGITGLVLASVTATIWMLPLALDAAIQLQWVEALKFLSLPLLIGIPLAMSWPHAGFIVRGFFLVEATATAFRLGWLYLVSPERLCSNYLLDDQKTLGQLLLVLGAAASLFLIWKLIFGRIRIEDSPSVS